MSATTFFDSANELATLTNTFAVNGTPTDPTTVTLTVTSPTGTQTSYTSFTHTANSGLYSKDVPCTEPGEWMGVWVGTGAASDETVVRWTVLDADVTLYCSPEALESRLVITDTNDRAEIEGCIRAVCAWIDEHCQDFFGRTTATRTFVPCDPWSLDIGSFVSITSLKTDTAANGTFSTTWAPTDYELLPYNPSTGREVKPYNKIRAVGTQMFPYLYGYGQRRDLVQIGGVWGWPAIPDAVREAALILSAETFKLKDAPFGVAGFDTFGAVRVRDNPKALNLLAPYRRLVLFA